MPTDQSTQIPEINRSNESVKYFLQASFDVENFNKSMRKSAKKIIRNINKLSPKYNELGNKLANNFIFIDSPAFDFEKDDRSHEFWVWFMCIQDYVKNLNKGEDFFDDVKSILGYLLDVTNSVYEGVLPEKQFKYASYGRKQIKNMLHLEDDSTLKDKVGNLIHLSKENEEGYERAIDKIIYNLTNENYVEFLEDTITCLKEMEQYFCKKKIDWKDRFTIRRTIGKADSIRKKLIYSTSAAYETLPYSNYLGLIAAVNTTLSEKDKESLLSKSDKEIVDTYIKPILEKAEPIKSTSSLYNNITRQKKFYSKLIKESKKALKF